MEIHWQKLHVGTGYQWGFFWRATCFYLVSYSDLPEIWFINLLDILENPIYFNNHKRIEMVEGPVIMIDLC